MYKMTICNKKAFMRAYIKKTNTSGFKPPMDLQQKSWLMLLHKWHIKLSLRDISWCDKQVKVLMADIVTTIHAFGNVKIPFADINYVQMKMVSFIWPQNILFGEQGRHLLQDIWISRASGVLTSNPIMWMIMWVMVNSMRAFKPTWTGK
jgi:hypothetical protein